MPIELRQAAGNTASLDSASCKVNLSPTTRQGSLLVVVASARVPSGASNPFPSDPSGFTRVAPTRREDDVAVTMWYRQNAAPITSVTVSGQHLSMAVRVLEVTGAAQANVLDRVTIGSGDSTTAASGATGTTAQADTLLVGAIVNQYASTTQSGFTGGLGRLPDLLTPTTDLDNERHRLTTHIATTSQVGSYALGARLSVARDWVAMLVSFRGGSLGPAKMSSKNQPPAIVISGRARLSAFGPMRSKTQPAAIRIGGRAWIGPFELQMRLGGKRGLLVGKGTPYRLEKLSGLGGWEIRDSDRPLPRGDGDQRGTDRQGSRLVMGQVNFDGPSAEMEAAMQLLLRALRPRPEQDYEVYFRLPGMPLQMIRCRPGSLTREIDGAQLLLMNQAFVLRAADPRIYSARWRELVVPVTPAGADAVPLAVTGLNSGNARAYPRITMRTGLVEVSSVQLVNATGNVAFEVVAPLPPRSELVGDMPARVTLQPVSYVTIDGQGKYGAWALPRTPFFLAPDPDAPDGVNALYLRTVPAGADVTCVLTWQDTSYG